MPDTVPTDATSAPAIETPAPVTPDVRPVAGKPAGAPAQGTPPALAGDAPAGDETPIASTWREDWREQIAGNDEAYLAKLKRYSSFDNWAKSTRDLYRKISAGELRTAMLSDEATEQEVAAYRKGWGIPDKPEGYDVKFPEGYEASDLDKADLGDFLKSMHAKNASQGFVNEAANWYFNLRGKVGLQLYEAAQQQTIANKATIKAEMGKDYERNVRVGNDDLIAVLGSDDSKQLPALTLNDGTKLGDHPLFVRYISQSGLRHAGDGVIALSEFQQSTKSLDDQYSEALDLKFKNPEKYHSDEHQNFLLRLAGAKNARKAA